MAATTAPAAPAKKDEKKSEEKKELMSFRLLNGNHDEPKLDENGERMFDEQGTPLTVHYRRGDVIKSHTDLCKKFNSKHPAFAKFRRSNKQEEQEWEEMQAAMVPEATDTDTDAFGQMSEKDLRAFAEENKVHIPLNVTSRAQIAELVRKSIG